MREAAPVVLGVDVARFGNDQSVIFPRQGRDARSRPIEVYQGLDTMQLAQKVFLAWQRYSASMVMVDGTGVGAGVVDRLRQLRVPVIEVIFGSKPDSTDTYETGVKYGRKKDEIFGSLRSWLKTGIIPDKLPARKKSLPQELSSIFYTLNRKNAIMLEPKAVYKKREDDSCDAADALACTFAVPWLMDYSKIDHSIVESEVRAHEYNPYEESRIHPGVYNKEWEDRQLLRLRFNQQRLQ